MLATTDTKAKTNHDEIPDVGAVALVHRGWSGRRDNFHARRPDRASDSGSTIAREPQRGLYAGIFHLVGNLHGCECVKLLFTGDVSCVCRCAQGQPSTLRFKR